MNVGRFTTGDGGTDFEWAGLGEAEQGQVGIESRSQMAFAMLQAENASGNRGNKVNSLRYVCVLDW